MKGFILAGDYRQYRTCLWDWELDHREWLYLGEIHRIRGRSGFTILCYGTWYTRKDASDILEYSKVLGATVLDTRPVTAGSG